MAKQNLGIHGIPRAAISRLNKIHFLTKPAITVEDKLKQLPPHTFGYKHTELTDILWQGSRPSSSFSLLHHTIPPSHEQTGNGTGDNKIPP
jgi:hypothetical protein